MKCLFLVLASLIFGYCQIAGATNKSLQKYSPQKKKSVLVDIISYENIEITKSCMKVNIPKCLAWNAIKSKPVKMAAQVTPLVGHPAANYCKSIGGTNFLFMEKRTEIDFCEFKDGSAVNSWDLFNAHH